MFVDLFLLTNQSIVSGTGWIVIARGGVLNAYLTLTSIELGKTKEMPQIMR